MSFSISKEDTLISDFFKTMEEASDSSDSLSLAKQWIKGIGYFAGIVDGKWLPLGTSTEETVDVEITKGLSVTLKWSSSDELEAALKNSQEGFKRWKHHEAAVKSQKLYRLSELIEEYSRMLNSINSLTKYGRLREKYDVHYLSDSFNYYATLVGDQKISKEWIPTGVVCIICDNNTLVSSLWVLSAVLASGNAAICLVDSKINLSAFFLAQLCNCARLPPGTFNVISCQISSLPSLPYVDKVILSSPKPEKFLSGTFNKNIPCEIIPNEWPCVIIYESADLDAVISNILEIIQIFDVEDPWPVCKIYLHESIQKKFIQLLTLKVCGSLGGNTEYRPPFYIMSNEVTVAQILSLLFEDNANNDMKKLLNVSKCHITEEGNQCIPAAIINFNSILKDQNTRYGPGVYIEQFRTVKESIAMFNQNKKNSNVSIWSEEIYLSLEAASKLKSRTVWINCHNIYTPSVSNGTLYLSGNSNIGGKEGVISHLMLESTSFKIFPSAPNNIQSYGTVPPNIKIIRLNSNEDESHQEKSHEENSHEVKSHEVKRTDIKFWKLYIGGSFVNSDDNTFVQLFDVNVPYANVATANKPDIDKAVASASSSQPKWENTLKIKRAAIFRKASEMLNKRKKEFVQELQITSRRKEYCIKEVEQAVAVLFYWANYIAQFEGLVVETKLNGKVFQEHHPLGVIGIQCPNEEPLLSFIFLITPAIIFGNSVVAILSEMFPTCCLKMCEVFQASGLPGGVLNVVSSSRTYLTRHLSSHLNIDAIWFSLDGDNFIYDSYYSIQPKKIFDCKNITNILNKTKTSKFLLESTYTKAIFIPMGTDFI